MLMFEDEPNWLAYEFGGVHPRASDHAEGVLETMRNVAVWPLSWCGLPILIARTVPKKKRLRHNT